MTDTIAKNVEKQDKLWQAPTRADRVVTFGFSALGTRDLSRLALDPSLSLQYALDKWHQRGDIIDDAIPMLRCEIGTGLVASAFGAELMFKPRAMPAVVTHPIQSLGDLERAGTPDPSASGYLTHMFAIIDYFKQNMPADFALCQCDLQGPWNTAQLLAGDKIFLDIYDDIHFVSTLLDAVTDFTIACVHRMKQAINEPSDYFHLQGIRIRGGSRICNCSTDMISPDFYARHLLPRDLRFFDAVGGGLMHICGNIPHCIEHFNRIGGLNALEINFNYLDVFDVADTVRDDVVLFCTGPVEFPLLTPLGKRTLDRFYDGTFPDKRNMVFHFNDPADPDKCKQLYDAVQQSN